jgi:hypothetical protein
VGSAETAAELNTAGPPPDRFPVNASQPLPPSRRPSGLRPLLILLAAAATANTHAQDWSPNLTTTATWHDNATNAKPAADRISGLQLQADLIASRRYAIGRDDAIHPALHLAGEWWPRFDGLTLGAAGVRLEWRHKFGLGALAPVFSIEAGADAVAVRESRRRGTSSVLLATFRKRFNDTTTITATQEFTDHNARAAVFDRKASETAVEVGRDLNATSRVTLRLAYRDGDVLSHATPPRPDLVALAPNRREIDTFGRPLTAYSLEARTLGAKAAFIQAIDRNSAAILSYEWRQTKRDPVRYLNQLVSLAVVHQF